MKAATWMWTWIVYSLVALACFSVSEAQSLPPLKPLPPPHDLKIHAAAVAATSSAASPWQPVKTPAPFATNACNIAGGGAGAANPILLTDGSVLIQDAGCPDWLRLTPDSSGSYANGTWTVIASLPATYAPLYHSSAVLPDGRLIIMGGEYNYFEGNYFVPVRTAEGAIYDPVANVWTPVAPPSFFTPLQIGPFPLMQTIGDAASIVLPNGVYMQSDCCTNQSALLDAKTLTWTPTGGGKFDINNEEGWNLLPSGEVLTVDAYVPFGGFPYMPTGTNSELYNYRTGRWHSAGSTIVQLWDSGLDCGEMKAPPPTPTFEVGPAVLRADGTVFATGSNTCPNGAGNTAIYNSYTGRWQPGPMFPEVDGVTDMNIADGPASWEPNDKVLMMASSSFGYVPPSFFFEWDGRHLNQVPSPPNAPIEASYLGNMLVLPTGQILFTDIITTDVELYTPTITDEDREFQETIAPAIIRAPLEVARSGSYEIEGFLFNGVTQGAAYGDDVQASTNFPLVRITNLETRHVFYSRTHDHSSMAVASHLPVSTHFDVPADQETGPSLLEVVANGIASRPWFVYVR